MRLEDLEHIDAAKNLFLNTRNDKETIRDGNLKEALDQAMLPKDKQSLVILKHRVDRLDFGQVCHLRDIILSTRIKESYLDDLLLEPSYKGAKPGRMIVKVESEEKIERPPIEIPEQIFVWKREDLKPIKRLEDKFNNIFASAYRDFQKFKEADIKNFAKSTQMTLEVIADCDIIK